MSLYDLRLNINRRVLPGQINRLSKLLQHLTDAEYESTVGAVQLLEDIRDKITLAKKPKRTPSVRTPHWVIAELWAADNDAEHLVAKAVGLSDQKELLRNALEQSWDPQASDAGMRRAYRYEDIDPPCREIVYKDDDGRTANIYIDVEMIRRRGHERAFEKAAGKDKSRIFSYDENTYYDDEGNNLLAP